jgi:hypothetical protein
MPDGEAIPSTTDCGPFITDNSSLPTVRPGRLFAASSVGFASIKGGSLAAASCEIAQRAGLWESVALRP